MTSTALQEPKCPLLVTSNLRFSKILRLEIIHMSYNMKECGNRIRQLRIKKGFTQGSIAGMLNIDRSFYSRIEAGKMAALLICLCSFPNYLKCHWITSFWANIVEP